MKREFAMMNAMKRMKQGTLAVLPWLVLMGAAGTFSAPAMAEDIDIFVGSSATADNPNVLILLDNTANWSRQSQKWPGGLQQGQSEANAIKTVINSLGARGNNINIGLMEFATNPGSNDGGFVRYAIRTMTPANVTAFGTQLQTIYDNITDPLEKINSGTPYGNLMYDAYNYYAGVNAWAPSSSVVASKADSAGYTTNYATFKSPLSSSTSCSKNYIILITNPAASGPTNDSAANLAALAALGGNTTQLKLPNFTSTSVSSNATLGNTSQCYATQGACTAAAGTGDYAAQCSAYSDGCSCGGTVASAGSAACSTGTLSYSVIGTTNAVAARTNTFTITGSSMGTVSGSNADWSITTSVASGLAVGSTVTIAGCAVGSGGKTLNGTQTVTSITGPTFRITANKGAPVCTAGTASQSVPAVSASTSVLGYTSACYASAGVCSTADYAALCSTFSGGCACGTPTVSTTPSCATGTSKYAVQGTDTVITNVPLNVSTTDTNTFNLDEWARFMYQNGVPLSGSSNKSITTYTIDVYNAQPNAQHTSLMLSTAKVGGGKYYLAGNESAIVDALSEILNEIQSVNSTFASASLPVSATNRAQNLNQVYIGMFRPDVLGKPRWFGNMKRYQLSGVTDIGLGDADGTNAVNTLTGFITECARSYWTFDSNNYWESVTYGLPSSVLNPDPRRGTACADYSGNSVYSDAPDGPFVEKGGVAQVIRAGNNPPTTVTTSTWQASGRNVLTNPIGGGNLVPFTAAYVASAGISAPLANFMLGQDVLGEKGTVGATTVRASIHGDVIHSRPLPVNYGTAGVTVFYGANDGTLRAINGDTGKERWAFIAPEFLSRLSRLSDNTPAVSYPPSPAVGSSRKDYFFDGNVGVYQNSDSSKVWIYPTMRRGGRMVYALDVNKNLIDTPQYKWKLGCPNLSNDTGCTAGMSGIGQTWSVPVVAVIKGYDAAKPVLLFGGGYDACEDTNGQIASECSGTKGNHVYVVDAETGAVIKVFDTDRSVTGDIAMVDADLDGKADFAYATTTGGSIYRFDFVSVGTNTSLASSNWTARKVAGTTGAGRKFLYGPSLLLESTRVYVFAGTGDREHPLESDYPYSSSVANRFYAYLDDLTVATGTVNLDDPGVITDAASASCTTASLSASSARKGWFLSMSGRGEQVISSSLVNSGLVYFSTNRAVPATAGACSTSLGEAKGYILNILTGSGAIGVNGLCGGSTSSVFIGGGLVPSPVLARNVSVSGHASPVNVLIGVAAKGGSMGASTSTSPCAANKISVAIDGQQVCLGLSEKRRRKYTYTKGN
jgi:Tfp pilus tip-associated adhesin PilY1